MSGFGERGPEMGRRADIGDLLRDTVREFHRYGVFRAYMAALDRETRSTREMELGRLARAEYPILARRVDCLTEAHPDNGRYFLAKLDPDTGKEIFAMPEGSHGRPADVDAPDSLVWVCTVAPTGEVALSPSFSQRQAAIVIAQAQAAEDAGFCPKGRLYLELGDGTMSL